MKIEVDMSRMRVADVESLRSTREVSGGVELISTSPVRKCHNLRETGIGVKAVGEPAMIAECEGRPVYTDCMNSDIYLFTQLDDGTVCVSRNGTGEIFTLGRVEESVCGGATVGDFVVFRLESGALVYLLREKGLGGYSWLGALPQLPSFRVEVNQEPEMSVEMEGCRFSTVLTEITNPVPAEVSEKVGDVWRDACNRLYEQIRGGGAWCEPVRVQLALRLWDGTRFDVSEPIRLCPAHRPGRERVSVGLLYSQTKKGFTGTDGTSLKGCGFTFTVTMEGELPKVWSGLVTGIEVWVSREPEALDKTRAPLMTFMHNTTGNFVSFMPAMLTDSEIDAAVESMPSGLVGFYAMPQQPGHVSLPAGVVYDSAIDNYSTPLPGNGEKADCILGYGGFLHLGAGDALYTSVRGNPLVVQSVSAGLGGDILSLRPQLAGGGAFTRQYIYVGTERGIVALCHKADGTHTNSRPISQERLAGSQSWQSTPQGVYALCLGGSLLCLRDAGASVVLTGLKDVVGLAWSNRYGELWLCRESVSIVLQTGFAGHLYTRGGAYLPIEGLFAPAWVYVVDPQGRVRIHTLEQEGGGLPHCCYECALAMSGAGILRRVVALMSAGEGISYHLEDDAGICLNRGALSEKVESVLSMTTMLCRVGKNLPARQRRLWLRLEGNIHEIKEVQIWG